MSCRASDGAALKWRLAAEEVRQWMPGMLRRWPGALLFRRARLPRRDAGQRQSYPSGAWMCECSAAPAQERVSMSLASRPLVSSRVCPVVLAFDDAAGAGAAQRRLGDPAGQVRLQHRGAPPQDMVLSRAAAAAGLLRLCCEVARRQPPPPPPFRRPWSSPARNVLSPETKDVGISFGFKREFVIACSEENVVSWLTGLDNT